MCITVLPQDLWLCELLSRLTSTYIMSDKTDRLVTDIGPFTSTFSAWAEHTPIRQPITSHLRQKKKKKKKSKIKPYIGFFILVVQCLGMTLRAEERNNIASLSRCFSSLILFLYESLPVYRVVVWTRLEDGRYGHWLSRKGALKYLKPKLLRSVWMSNRPCAVLKYASEYHMYLMHHLL